jgi:prostaglandin-E synthase 1
MTSIRLYVVFTTLLALNLLGLWIYSGTVRGKTKTTPNEEDARTILPGSKLTDVEPPEIQRVLRAHANAMANIIPFLFLGHLWIEVGTPKPLTVLIVCGTFTLARYGHSFTYVKGAQPWRSAFWALGVLATLALVVLLTLGTFA